MIILPGCIDEHQVLPVVSDRVFADFRGEYGSVLSSLANAIKNRPRCQAVKHSDDRDPR
jgi:hypothetical protein